MDKDRREVVKELADKLFETNPTAALMFLRAWLFAETDEARLRLEQSVEITIRNK